MEPSLNIIPAVGCMPLQSLITNNTTTAPNKQSYVKRPMNSFLLWSRAERKKVVSEHPKMHISEINKILAVLWKQLSHEDKKPFIDEAKRLREQFEKDHPDCKLRSLRKPKRGMKPSDTLYPISDNSASPNRFDAKNFMNSAHFFAHEAEARVNPVATSKSPYGLPFASQPPTTYEFDPYCMENLQLKSMSARNVQSSMSSYQPYKFMYQNRNLYGQEVCTNDSGYSIPNNSHSIICSSPERQQNGSSPIYMQAQATVPSHVQTSSAYTFLTFPSINTEFLASPLTFADHLFSEFPTIETESSFSPSLPIYASSDQGYALQTPSPLTLEYPSSAGMSVNNSCAQPQIPVTIPNSSPEQSQFIQCVYGQHPNNLTSLEANGLYESFSMYFADLFLCSHDMLTSQE